MAGLLEGALAEPPLSSLFAPSASFTSLFNALSRIQGDAPGSSDEATKQLLTAVCKHGHASFTADYIGEICANPNLSSTDIRHMAVMNGDVVQAWLVESTASMV
jgi:hypothetical protein